MAVIDDGNAPNLLDGSTDNDTIDGNGGNDTIRGFAGDDLITGGNGDDSIESGDGNDTVHGGNGNDVLINGGGVDLSYGGDGDDVIRMSESVLPSSVGRAYGGDGNDVIFAHNGSNAFAYGGAGHDTLFYSTSIFHNIDAHTVIDFSTGAGTVTHALGGLVTFAGFERLVFMNFGANDSVTGGSGNDEIWVGEGANFVDAGGGNDLVVYGFSLAQTLDGGLGDDTLRASSEDEAIYFIINPTTGEIDDGRLSTITGFEHYQILGGSQNDVVRTAGGQDRIDLGKGDDTAEGMGGRDLIRGGQGDDLLFGGDGHDRMNGNANADELFGGSGNDTLTGAKGSDTLTGGDGDDTFIFIIGENGRDVIADFGVGDDVIHYAGANIGPLAPPAGFLSAGQVSNGGPVGTQAQFVTTYNATTDETQLLWFDQGTATSGAMSLLYLSGNVTLQASDIFIF